LVDVGDPGGSGDDELTLSGEIEEELQFFRAWRNNDVFGSVFGVE
jgi:hypothetical protein